MLTRVSFFAPSLPLLIGEKQISIGSAHMAVKKLNGAALAIPLSSIVVTNAIGRGSIEPTVAYKRLSIQVYPEQFP